MINIIMTHIKNILFATIGKQINSLLIWVGIYLEEYHRKEKDSVQHFILLFLSLTKQIIYHFM